MWNVYQFANITNNTKKFKQAQSDVLFNIALLENEELTGLWNCPIIGFTILSLRKSLPYTAKLKRRLNIITRKHSLSLFSKLIRRYPLL